MRTILGGVMGRIPVPSPAMVVALLALLIAASGAAVAAIPSADGTITACRDNKSGELQAIDAEGGQTCDSKETRLAWKDGITGKVADSEKLDGLDSTEFAKAYERTVIVSPVGTDTQNGQALLDALASIKDASASKPYLLYIEPGIYDLGVGSPFGTGLQMKEHVDIQGAGEGTTLITSAITICENGTLMGADNVELRFLTVRNTGTNAPGTTCSIAILNANSTGSPRLTHVTAEATGGGFENVAIWNVAAASPQLTHVRAEAIGVANKNIGVFNDLGSNTTMTDVTATASGGNTNTGVQNFTANTTIRQSKLTGSTASMSMVGGTVQVALTQFVGPLGISVPPGTLQCFNNYDENMAAVSCP